MLYAYASNIYTLLKIVLEYFKAIAQIIISIMRFKNSMIKFHAV